MIEVVPASGILSFFNRKKKKSAQYVYREVNGKPTSNGASVTALPHKIRHVGLSDGNYLLLDF
jgi:hypothetical protein